MLQGCYRCYKGKREIEKAEAGGKGVRSGGLNRNLALNLNLWGFAVGGGRLRLRLRLGLRVRLRLRLRLRVKRINGGCYLLRRGEIGMGKAAFGKSDGLTFRNRKRWVLAMGRRGACPGLGQDRPGKAKTDD